MKSKKRMFIGRRIFSLLRAPLSINFSFISRWNNPKASRIIKGKSWDVSSKGLCLETEIDMRDGVLEFSETEAAEKEKVLPYLVLSEKEIELELNLPPKGNKTLVMGKPIWYEFTSGESTSRLKICILFKGMPREVLNNWLRHIKHADFPRTS